MARGQPANWPTKRRIAWLEELEHKGKARRAGWRVVPNHCMQLGLTQWCDAGGGDFREELTEEGRRVLAEWKARAESTTTEGTNAGANCALEGGNG